MTNFILGIDFDNTIVCYDEIFRTIAIERGIIPTTIAPIKEDVRNYLRSIGKEDLWTELQGFVYGPGIVRAPPFEGVKEFLRHCKENQIKVRIISHKTKEPFLGPKYDLHKSALEWLEKNGFFQEEIGLMEKDVFLELTKGEKAARIETEGCTHFIDDLPEFFSELNFPKNVIKILFDPQKKYLSDELMRLHSWKEIVTIAPEFDFQKYFPEPISSIEKINNLGNNRLYKIVLPSGDKLLKKYSKIHAQNWPRGEREFLAIQYLWKRGFKDIPRPFGFYPEDNVAIYSFEPGRILNPEEVGEQEIKNIADFVARLHSLSVEDFPPASTPALCPDDFAKIIEVRIKNIKEQCRPENLDENTRQFVFDEVIPKSESLIADFRKLFSQEELLKEIPREEQRLDFGDFGIHNILVDQKGDYTFLDFEYFGREDPVREILGFLHHDKHVKISRDLKQLFVDHYLQKAKISQRFLYRMKAADALNGINFVLVYLNVVRPQYIGQLKEQGADVNAIIKERIDKARKKMKNITFFD